MKSLMKKCSFCWLLLQTYITMHGSKNSDFTYIHFEGKIKGTN